MSRRGGGVGRSGEEGIRNGVKRERLKGGGGEGGGREGGGEGGRQGVGGVLLLR